MKFLDILSSATSNMLRSKTRTLLTIIAIFIGALTITLTIGISSGVSSYIDKQVGNVGAKDVLIVQKKVDRNQSSGPQKYDPNENSTNAHAASMLADKDLDKIKSQKGLIDIKPIVFVTTDYISGENGDKYKISLTQTVDSQNLDLTAGGKADNHSVTPQIILTHDYVDVLGYKTDSDAVGQYVNIGIKSPLGKQGTVSALIVGVQQKTIVTQGGMTSNDALINQLHAIQTAGQPLELSNQYSVVIARFDITISQQELQDIKNGLDEKGYTAKTIEDAIGIIKNVIDAITYVLIFFGAIALLAASFGIVNTLLMSVQERTKEIGLMKAMGMSRSKIFLLFSIEAVLLGFWGSLLGVVAAGSIGQIANRVASNSFLKDLPGFSLTAFPILSTLMVMGLIMLIAFLAGTLPARRAAKLDPIDALRYE